jgi:hypothetical protein
MAKLKFDGVVQAVHYQPDGQVGWVRAFLRRGPTFSDRILVDRQTLVAQLKAGKRYYAGQRQHQMASTFEISQPLRVIEKNGKDILITGDVNSERDCLDGVPVI